MGAVFAGETARLYARHRRDLPADQARALAGHLGLEADDVVVDLGCGTGQLAVPVRVHCAGVVAVDPEPAMLAELRHRDAPGVLCVLGSDGDLPELGRLITGRVGAVVIGNALHWMDEPVALAACAELLRPDGGIAVVTQGPPLWLGPAPWQADVRAVLEQFFGPATDPCGSDTAALDTRAGMLQSLRLTVRVEIRTSIHAVGADWVLGHLGSTVPAGALREGDPGGPAEALRATLARHGELMESVTTTALIARRPA
jgi:SAM-dependent methyltransferase